MLILNNFSIFVFMKNKISLIKNLILIKLINFYWLFDIIIFIFDRENLKDIWYCIINKVFSGS